MLPAVTVFSVLSLPAAFVTVRVMV